MFTGGGDGLVLLHDLRMRDPSSIVWHHNAAVQDLAFEDPWLVSASAGRLRGCKKGLGGWGGGCCSYVSLKMYHRESRGLLHIDSMVKYVQVVTKSSVKGHCLAGW